MIRCKLDFKFQEVFLRGFFVCVGAGLCSFIIWSTKVQAFVLFFAPLRFGLS